MENEWILKEIDLVQSEIARYDGNGLTIKNWCIVLWSTLLAFAFKENNQQIVLIAIGSTILFASIELSYRLTQSRFILRAIEIEEMLSSQNLDNYEYSVSRTARKKISSYTPWVSLKIVITKPQFYVFYLGLIIMGVYGHHLIKS